jgi:hypothetical protein
LEFLKDFKMKENPTKRPLTPGEQRHRDLLARQKAGRQSRLEKGTITMATNTGKSIIDRLAERIKEQGKEATAPAPPISP